jgi:hypothetical protein
MALPILAARITGALVKRGKKAKKDSKVSSQKLLPSSITSSTKSRAQFSKVEPRKLAPYRKKVETTKFLPYSNVNEQFSVSKFDALLTSLVGSTASLQRITKKDLGDARQSNRTKDNAIQKSKRERNEEKIESKKTITKVSKPMKLTVPSLFKDIFKIGGRLILSLGIMELLKFLDPEKKDSIFGFLMNHLDKIVLGALGILATTYVASFTPVISMIGTIIGIMSPIIFSMAGLLLNPMIWALLGIGYAATKQKLGPGEKEMVKQLEDQLPEEDRDNALKVFAESNRKKLIEKLKKQKENLNPFEYYAQGIGLEIEENIRFLETGKFSHGIEIEGLTGLPFNYEMGGELDFETGEASGGFSFRNPFKKPPAPKAEPPTPPAPKAEPQTSLMPEVTSDVKKVIIGAGHAEDPNRPGSNLGTDGRPVEGTADDGSSGSNTPANATGVTESQLTRYIVDKLKAEVDKRGLNDKIGFRDIYSWDGLKRVPREVEGVKGQQYVDIHADARGFGKAGVLPSANESATDRSLMNEFGRYSKSFKPSSKDVTAGGGTLLEIGRIDDPKLRALLLELKSGKAGPATKEMIDKILRGLLPGISSSNIKPVKPPNTAQQVGYQPYYEKQGFRVAIFKKEVPVPVPVPSSGGGVSPSGSSHIDTGDTFLTSLFA